MNILKLLGIKSGKTSKSKIPKKELDRRTVILTSLKTLLILTITLAFVVFGVILGAAIGYITTSEPVTDDMLNFKTESTKLYYSDGKTVITELDSTTNKNRIPVAYEDVPENLRDAFVALEDKRFYDHGGVDFIRTTKAILELFQKDKGSGGSTITQQLVKNVTGDDSNSMPRKVREIWRAMQLDKRFEKEDILEYYMNIIYMGYDIYGVQAASLAYFGKDVSTLDLAECALLAGITNNPSRYNPLTVKGRENSYKRQNTTLKLMLEQGYITQEEFDAAKAQELTFCDSYKSTKNKLSYFVEQVISEVRTDLMTQKNITRAEANNIIYGSGAKIYTTLDKNVQDALDTVYKNIDNFPYNKNHPEFSAFPEYQVQSATVVIDPITGYVCGLYGGSGEKQINFGLNRATQINRQPGSTLKPIMIYGPLLDNGKITLSTVMNDTPQYLDINNPTRLYPNNFENNVFKGPMTVTTALAESNNVIPTILFRDNMDYCLESLANLGIDRKTEKYLSTALGGLSKGINPMSLAAAYVPLANSGFYYTPTCYIKFVDKNGIDIVEHTPDSQKKNSEKNLVYTSETTSYLMTEALKTVITEGTAKGKINIKDNKGGNVEAAGKTGTTDNYRDSWFAGYTPSYVAATWYGFDDNEYLTGKDRTQSVSIWNEVMKEIHKNMDPVSFSSRRIVSKDICKYSGLLATDYCKADIRGDQTSKIYFAENSSNIPTQTCNCHIEICTTGNGTAHKGCPASSRKVILTNRPFSFNRVFDKTPIPADMQLSNYVSQAPSKKCTVHGTSGENPGTDNPQVTNSSENTTPSNTTAPPVSTSQPATTAAHTEETTADP